ncbi:MAG: matrixin family metalloprotease [Rubripirellula sp.]
MRDRRKHRRRLAAETLEIRRCLAASLGWDGPGQGSAELTYYVGAAPAGIGQAAFESAIETALDAWSDVVDVQFTQTSQPNLRDSIDFEFGSIDGAGGTLAQAYFPDDVNPARLAGDVEFDIAENWEIGNGQGNRAFDLVQVAVHEIGHSLGIDHLHDHDAVLAPTVSASQSFRSLSPADIDAALEIYAPAAVDRPTTEVIEPVSPALDTDSVATNEDSSFEINPPSEPDSFDSRLNRRPWFRFWGGFRGFWFHFQSRVNATPQQQASLSANVNQDNSVSSRDAVQNLRTGLDPQDELTGTTANGQSTFSGPLLSYNSTSNESADASERNSDLRRSPNELETLNGSEASSWRGNRGRLRGGIGLRSFFVFRFRS